MSWLQRLVETYDACAGAEQFEQKPLPPIGHTPQQAHIEIVLDGSGNFKRARTIAKEETLIPATEKSAGRSGTKPTPHPLCDKIQYVAGDHLAHGGSKSFHSEYLAELEGWCASPYTHPKARAVLDYVKRGTVVADLVREKILHLGIEGKLLTEWEGDGDKPEIFRHIAGAKGEQDQGGAFVRWVVEIPGELESAVWRDAGLQKAWISHNASQMQRTGLCMATGDVNVSLTGSHPKRLRHPGDGAKLISANDASGFTFRGRFTDTSGDQACGIGFIASQKAHLALRWLIERQGSRNGDQAVVAWSVGGDDIPDPLADTFALFGSSAAPVAAGYSGDAGQSYSRALRSRIAGYRAKLSMDSTVVIMGLDAATPGRMAVIFYREMGGAEFLDRIETWHSRLTWHLRYGKDFHFTGAPAPRDIAQAAYGENVDDRLRKACVERLLPCIADGRPLPRDLVECAIRRATQRVSMKEHEWEKTLGIACALFKGYHTERNYNMALEADRISRDYLYGRLLAIAEHIEDRALRIAGEKRDTMATRLMHRFSNHPYSTWRTIELALQPYKSRLRSSAPGSLNWLEKQIDDICGQFQADDFINDRKLSGEFLLGYHCQRAKLYEPKPTANGIDVSPVEEQPE